MTQSVAIIESIIAVFTAVLGWLVDAIEAVIPLFWATETGLTFLGVLSVISVIIGIFFLVMRVIQNFLGFRS